MKREIILPTKKKEVVSNSGTYCKFLYLHAELKTLIIRKQIPCFILSSIQIIR